MTAITPARGFVVLPLCLVLAAAGCRDGQHAALPAATHDAANAAPSLAGLPPAAASAGVRYEFVPRAADADGDALTFSIRNKPAWAGFDARTGVLSGTPQARDAGRTNGVEISVSDGQAVTALAAFNIDVTHTETRSVTLSWMPPAYNADGSTLVDLAGFRIYYGNRAGEFPFVIEIENPGLTTFVVEHLMPGTYYFATTAVDAAGAESSLSEVVRVKI